MSCQDSNLKSLLSPARSGTFFAPFRSRSANPEGFDSKMKLWIHAIEEWTVINKRLTISLSEIQQTFISDSGVRPDKECLRLVFSEMKRQLRLVSSSSLKTSKIWTSDSNTLHVLGNYIDTKGWLGWGVTNLVYNPAAWALTALTSGTETTFSDLTDLSITDDMRFYCLKSLNELSQNLLAELVRIAKAEKQFCFEWQHLLELIAPMTNTILDVSDNKELLVMIDTLMEYLAIKRHIAIKIDDDDDSKLVKISNPDDSQEDGVIITKKDIALARLLRAKEVLKVDADKYLNQAQSVKKDALERYNRKDMSTAKSLMRSHLRLADYAEQKMSQLNNVETMIDELENTQSNLMIIRAYKDGSEALKLANNLNSLHISSDPIFSPMKTNNDDILNTIEIFTPVKSNNDNFFTPAKIKPIQEMEKNDTGANDSIKDNSEKQDDKDNKIASEQKCDKIAYPDTKSLMDILDELEVPTNLNLEENVCSETMVQEKVRDRQKIAPVLESAI